MTSPVQVGPATITINRDDRVLVCQPDGSILGSSDDGFFTRDTRFLSGYRLRLNGQSPVLLNAAPIRFFSARFEHTNPALLDRDGPIAAPEPRDPPRPHRSPAASTRTWTSSNYARRPVRLNVELELLSDFADIFDVKGGGVVQRGAIDAQWFRSRQELRTVYRNGDFRRELIIAVLAVRRARPVRQRAAAVRRPDRAQGRVARVHVVAADHPQRVRPPAGRAALQRRGDAAPPGRGEPAAGRRASTPRTGTSSGRGAGRSPTSRRCGSRTRRSSAASWCRPPASRGSSRCSAATRSSSRCRRSAATRSSRTARCGGWARSRRPTTTRCGTWSRARSRTRSATASSRRRACCRSRPTTGPTTRRRST